MLTMVKRHRCIRVLIALSLLMVPLFLSMNKKVGLISERSDLMNTNMTKYAAKSVRGRKMMRILYWNTFRGFADYSFGTGNAPFVRGGCKVSSCIATSSRAELKSADAVMFHVPDLSFSPGDRPKIRLPHQKYVFFLRESPANSLLKMAHFNNFFNISMTYSRHSDIRWPYGILERRIEEAPLPYNEHIFTQKTKFAVAFISNCNSQSERRTLIKALQKYIPIDVYGACSDKPSNTYDQDCVQSYDPQCSRRIILKYKFYLAFENSLCRDYITEKLYKVLDQPVIPVVYGGGNYSELLPKNSYINVMDFKDVKSLVDHLNTVANDAEKYLNYFHWRRRYKQVAKIRFIYTPRKRYDFLQLEPQTMCDLCEYLHTHQTERKSIANLQRFWGKNQNCINPNPWLKRFIKG